MTDLILSEHFELDGVEYVATSQSLNNTDDKIEDLWTRGTDLIIHKVHRYPDGGFQCHIWQGSGLFSVKDQDNFLSAFYTVQPAGGNELEDFGVSWDPTIVF